MRKLTLLTAWCYADRSQSGVRSLPPNEAPGMAASRLQRYQDADVRQRCSCSRLRKEQAVTSEQ